MEIKEQFQNRKPIILRTPLNSSDRELVTLSECSLDSNVFKGSQGSVFSLQNQRLKMMFICKNFLRFIKEIVKVIEIKIF